MDYTLFLYGLAVSVAIGLLLMYVISLVNKRVSALAAIVFLLIKAKESNRHENDKK